MRLTDRTSLTTAALNDLMHIVDISDKTDSDEGTSKKIRIDDMGFQLYSQKGKANGYTPLNSNVKIDTQYLPSYVDDVLEFTNRLAFPTTGEAGKIYIAKDTNFCYRWSGTVYVQVGGGGSGDVETVFGRMGNIVAAQGDYKTSLITNDSNVSGAYLDDALDWLNANKAAYNHTHTFSSITSKPTTLSGYGITNAYTKGESNNSFLRKDVNDTFSGQFLTLNNTANHGIVTGSDSQRLLIGGGSSWNGANGAYISIEGNDYGGTNAGGNIHLLPASGGVVNSATGLKISSASGGITNSNNNVMLRSNGTATVLSSANDAVYIRPVSDSSTTGQLVVNTSGSVVTSNNLTVNGSAIVSGNLNADIVIGQGNANAIRVHGTGTGDANVAYASFYENNGSTRQGYVGFGSSSNSNLIIRNDIFESDIRLDSDGVNGFKFYDGTSTRTVYHSGNLRSNSQNDARYYTKGQSDNNYVKTNARTDTGYAWIRYSTTGSILYVTNQGTGDIARFYSGSGDGSVQTVIRNNGSIYMPSGGDIQMYSTGGIQRFSYNSGHLIGAHNTLGNSQDATNPIYTIGGSYNPFAYSLDNMYGIGFAQGSAASFLNATDLGRTPSTGWGLYVAAAGKATVFLDGSNGRGHFKGFVYSAGFFENSDERLKKNITPLENSLSKLESIGGYTYDWKEDSKSDMGVIAQEVEKVLPLAVSTDSEGMKSVNYSKLVPVLIEAIKELSNEVKALRNG